MFLTVMMLLTAATPPTVEQILQRYESAVGDPAIAKSHESRIVRSRFEEASGGEAEVFEYYFAPDKYLQIMVLSEGLVRRMGIDGKSFWNDSPRGIDVLPVEKMQPVARDAVFNRHLKLREIYRDLRVVGPADVAGKPAWQVEGTGADGEKEQMFFDVATGLLVRRMFALVLPNGSRIPRDYVYEDYVDYGGVKMPSRIRHFAPSAAIFTVERVDHNADLYEFIFSPPPCGEKK